MPTPDRSEGIGDPKRPGVKRAAFNLPVELAVSRYQPPPELQSQGQEKTVVERAADLQPDFQSDLPQRQCLMGNQRDGGETAQVQAAFVDFDLAPTQLLE